MNEDLEQLLLNLKLKTIAARFDEMLAAAEQNGTPVQTLLTQLLRAEWHARQEKALQARIDRADFPKPWTLESFPFKMQKGVNERQIRTFAELDFIPKAENIVFIGETGVGKTGLMISLAARPCRTAIGPCSSRHRICSTKCTPRSPIDRLAGS
jgi:DNA replication protein DnaC